LDTIGDLNLKEIMALANAYLAMYLLHWHQKGCEKSLIVGFHALMCKEKALNWNFKSY